MPNLEHVSPVMTQCATQEGLGLNPFRLFGLRVDLTSKELDHAIKDLRVQMEFGAELPHAFALGTVEASTLVQANQRLRDPVQRLCDECFWFWPMDMGQQDAALDLIATGDKAGAKAAWKESLDHPEWGPIAAHNIAILGLYESFDDSTELAGFATNSKNFLGNPVCVNRLKGRLRTLDDPRLPRNSAQEIVDEIKRAMAANQVRIGLERMAQGDTVRGNRNLRCAQTIADDEELLGVLAEEALESDFRRLEGKGNIDIEKAKDADWESLATDSQKLIERLKPFTALADRAQIIGNNAAKTLRLISIHTYNEKKNRKRALAIALKAQKLACGELLQKINEDIETVKEGIEDEKSEAVFDPIAARIKKLSESTHHLLLATAAKELLEAINKGVDEGHSKQRADVLYHNLGWALRGQAVDVFNNRNDLNLARILVGLANEVVRASTSRGLPQAELRNKLLMDSAALDRNAMASAQSSGGSCLIPLVALLCLTGAAGYAAPMALRTAHHFIKAILP